MAVLDLPVPPFCDAMASTICQYLLSLDRRHLLGVPEVASGSGLSIVLPNELLERIRSRNEE
jgi:hypothetical protein